MSGGHKQGLEPHLDPVSLGSYEGWIRLLARAQSALILSDQAYWISLQRDSQPTPVPRAGELRVSPVAWLPPETALARHSRCGEGPGLWSNGRQERPSWKP